MEKIKSPMRAFRERLSMSQAEMAAMIGCSNAHLYKIESGFVDISPKIIDALAEVDPEVAEVIGEQHKKYMDQKRANIKERAKTTISEEGK